MVRLLIKAAYRDARRVHAAEYNRNANPSRPTGSSLSALNVSQWLGHPLRLPHGARARTRTSRSRAMRWQVWRPCGESEPPEVLVSAAREA
jgi:hypothetical protein